MRDLNLGQVLPTDDRRLECVVNGLTAYHGKQVAVDATLVSTLKGTGEPRPKALREDGAALADARKAKERKYPELVGSRRCLFVVTAMEVGGRWSTEACDFLETLAAGRALDAPRLLRASAKKAWQRRWTSFVAVAGMRAFADTLLHDTARNTELLEGDGPALDQLLGSEPHGEAPTCSRLPLRT